MGIIALASYAVPPRAALAAALAVRETGPEGLPKPRLLEQTDYPQRPPLTGTLGAQPILVESVLGGGHP